jgi:hypothetical protein
MTTAASMVVDRAVAFNGPLGLRLQLRFARDGLQQIALSRSTAGSGSFDGFDANWTKLEPSGAFYCASRAQKGPPRHPLPASSERTLAHRTPLSFGFAA